MALYSGGVWITAPPMTNSRARQARDHRDARGALLRRAWHGLIDHLPRQTPAGAARNLVARANVARDASRYTLAAGLYEEALRQRPDQPRLHIQCGHMFKEAGDYPSAEEHYLQAARLLGDDPDLALQLGHFYKVSLRPDEAETAYRRALALRPGWEIAAEELARIKASVDAHDVPAGSDARTVEIVAELLPQPTTRPAPIPDRLRVTHLAPRRTRSAWGTMKVLRGVEAIRGYYVSAVAPSAVQILLDGEEILRAPFAAPTDARSARQQKYVFNIWHDFSQVAPGRYQIEVRVIDARVIGRKHIESVTVVAPWADADWPQADGVVSPPDDAARPLDERINSLPSMVRSARRTPLPTPVRTILVQRADQLGDLVCSVPAIRRLRDLFPDARLIGLLSPGNADLGAALGLFDDIVVARFGEQGGERRRVMVAEEQLKLRRTLARHAIDLAIDLCEVPDSRPLLLLSGARFLFGFGAKEWPWLNAGFDFRTHDGSNGLEAAPASRKLLALVEAVGALREGAAHPLLLPDPDWRRLESYGIAPGERFIVLHTGARLAFSRWPGFDALARRILAQTDYSIVLMGEDLTDAPTLTDDRLHIIRGLMPFEDFDTLLSVCAGFVGNDSGTKHLAALRGAPVVSLHMARLNWSEWGQEISGTIISRRVPCAGCAIHHNPEECGKEFACIRQIKVEEVFDAVVGVAQEARNSHGSIEEK